MERIIGAITATLLSSSSSSGSNYSSESTSSSSEEDLYEHELLSSYKPVTKKSRVVNFIEDVVDNYTEYEFRSHFRVHRSTAEVIIQKYAESEYFKVKPLGGRKEIPAKVQILSFIWFCSNKDSYREVCNIFGQSEASFFKHLNLIHDFFFDFAKTVIKFPDTHEEKEDMAYEFEQISGFKNVLGCIDGTYVYIRKPANKIRSTYVNRHDLLSITLQAISDSQKKFLDVCVGCPSKVHDARVFALSPISKELPNICQGQYHLLGDAAYPLREYLLTPFKDTGHMTLRKKKYNLMHAQTRVKIENAFQLLKTRFRQLMRLDFFEVERMSKFVLACCVLHNICINEHDFFEDDMEEPAEPTAIDNIEIQQQAETSRNAALRRLGEIKRNEITNNLN